MSSATGTSTPGGQDQDRVFEEKSKSFLAEFLSQRYSTFHTDLQITNLTSQGRGRGIIATADIPADEILFTIPRHYVISVQDSSLFKNHPEVFNHYNDSDWDYEALIEADDDDDDDDFEEGLPKPWLDLILVLLHDYFHQNISVWKQYWDILPEKFDTLMFWTDEEKAQLQASNVGDKIGRDHADKVFNKIVIPLIKKHESIFYDDSAIRPSSDDVLLRLCHRMGSLIMAYAFDLETQDHDSDSAADSEGEDDGWKEDRDPSTDMGMVPMADLLNADAEFNAHLEHGDTVLTMRSLRLIRQGEEVLNYYGPLGNADLARRYGYTTSLHSRYDAVEIQWGDVLESIGDYCLTAKGKKIDTDRIRNDEDSDFLDGFVLERDSGVPEETGLFSKDAKFSWFPPELETEVTSVARECLGLSDRSEHDREQIKFCFLRIMEIFLVKKLKEYQTTVEDDEETIEAGGSSLTNRLRMAIDIRLGEKRLLKEALVFARVSMRKYPSLMKKESRPLDSDAMEVEQGPAQKKQKTKK